MALKDSVGGRFRCSPVSPRPFSTCRLKLYALTLRCSSSTHFRSDRSCRRTLAGARDLSREWRYVSINHGDERQVDIAGAPKPALSTCAKYLM